MKQNKLLALYDQGEQEEYAIIQKTKIIIKDPETGIEMFRGTNKVLVSGSAFTAAKHFNIKPNVFTPSYNSMLNLEKSRFETYQEDGIRKAEQVYLFAVGTDGCGQENSQVFDVNYTKWIAPQDLIPLRYQLDTDDLGAHMRDKYFGRKIIGNRVAYYFKGFESAPEFKQQYIDGTPIDENIYLSNRLEKVESFVELNLKITKEDCRDFFLSTTGINDARVNTISLLTAWETVEDDGYKYYHDIRPLTKLNFPNETLIDTSKGLDIIYYIYY